MTAYNTRLSAKIGKDNAIQITSQSDGYDSFYPSWSTKQGLIEIFGPSHNSDWCYPLIPNFLHLARASEIKIGEKVLNTIEEVIEERDITIDKFEEKFQKSIEKQLKNALNEIAIKREVLQLLVEETGGNSENNPNVSQEFEFSGVVDTAKIFEEIISYAKCAATNKIRKSDIHGKRRKKAKKSREYTASVVSFEFDCSCLSGGDTKFTVEFTGKDADFVKLLLPVIYKVREKSEKMTQWRVYGVPEAERDWMCNVNKASACKKVDDAIATPESKGRCVWCNRFVMFDHQWTMYKINQLFDESVNCSEMGTGKTMAAIANLDQRIKSGDIRPGSILVVCTTSLCENWQAEIKQVAPWLTSRIIQGTYWERLAIIMNKDSITAQVGGKPVDIHLINYNSFTMKWKDKSGTALDFADIVGIKDKWGEPIWDAVILDEVHHIKNPQATTTQNCLRALADIRHKVIMTGTLAANKLHDIHTPMLLIKRGMNFHSVLDRHVQVDEKTGKEGQKFLTPDTMHEHFLQAYFTRNGFNYIPNAGVVKLFRKRVEECGVRFEKKEVLKSLPDKLYVMRMVDLAPEHMRAYNLLKASVFNDLANLIGSGGKVTMMHILAMLTKLSEAANGWIYDDSHSLVTFPWNAKLDELKEICNEEIEDEHKIVIWARFLEDIHMIKREFIEQALTMHGGATRCNKCGSPPIGQPRFDAVRKFNTDSETRYLVANPASGGEGLNMTGASYEIFFGNSFNKVHRVQAEDRCHRIGMKDSLTIIDIVAKNTIDIEMLEAIKSWKSMSRALFKHLGIPEEKLDEVLGGKPDDELDEGKSLETAVVSMPKKDLALVSTGVCSRCGSDLMSCPYCNKKSGICLNMDCVDFKSDCGCKSKSA